QQVAGLDEVAGPRPICMVADKRGPDLAATGTRSDAPHVLLDGALADLDTDLEQLAADALGSPQTAAASHVANEVNRFLRDWGPITRAGSALPEEAEASAVPSNDGLGLDEDDRPTPGREQARSQDHLQPIESREHGALDATSEDVELMTKHSVLDDQL